MAVSWEVISSGPEAGLRLWHIAEPLVARMLCRLGPRAFADLPVYCPVHRRDRPMSDFEPVPPVSTSSKVKLNQLSPQFRFATSQALDVVAVFGGHARAFEVKLGDTPLGVASFRNAYSDGSPRVSGHDPPRVSGKVVPILEAIGAPLLGSEDVRISLSVRDEVRGDVPVLREWFLVVTRQTLDLWRGPDLFGLLEVRRLTGVIAVESIAEALGVDRARRQAKEIAKEAIDTWFDGRRVPYRPGRVRGR